MDDDDRKRRISYDGSPHPTGMAPATRRHRRELTRLARRFRMPEQYLVRVVRACARDNDSVAEAIRVVDIKPGKGRRGGFEDSDWVITLAYRFPVPRYLEMRAEGWHGEPWAIYGLLDGTPSLWAN